MCYFNNIIRIEDFNLGNVLIGEKSNEVILVYNISCKFLIENFHTKLCVLDSIKQMDLLEFMM